MALGEGKQLQLFPAGVFRASMVTRSQAEGGKTKRSKVRCADATVDRYATASAAAAAVTHGAPASGQDPARHVQHANPSRHGAQRPPPCGQPATRKANQSPANERAIGLRLGWIGLRTMFALIHFAPW
jgi:hypothetical protein